MKTLQDRTMAAVGILLGIILISILAGDRIPLPIRVFTFGIALQCVFFSVIQWSLRRSDNSRPWLIGWAAVSTLMTIIVIGIIVLHFRYDNQEQLIAGMEPATALLVFGVTLTPFGYVFLWTAGFFRAIFPPGSSRRLTQLRERDKD